jgi:hypothetical protein
VAPTGLCGARDRAGDDRLDSVRFAVHIPMSGQL